MRRRFSAFAMSLVLCWLGTAQAEIPPNIVPASIQTAQSGMFHTFFFSYWPWLSTVLDAGLVVAVVVLWRMRGKNRLLQCALDQTNEAMYIQDASLRFVDVNDTACRMLGYSREELLGMGPTDIDPDVTQEAIKRAFQTEDLGKPHAFESRHRTRDGRIFPVELSGTFFEEGGVRYVVTMVRDISERKQSQQRLELFERAIDQSGDAVFLVDDEANFRYVNETACRSLGYSREELLAMTPPDINPDMTLERVRNMTRTGAGAVRIFETRHRARDGDIFPVEVSGVSFESDGRKFSLVSAHDITERKRLEKRLAESEFQFRSLAEHAPDNIIRYDRQFRFLYCNPQAERTMGRTSAELAGKMSGEVFSHGEFDEVGELLKRTLISEQENVHVIATPDAGEGARIHHLRCVPEFDEDGEVASLLLFGRDMTELYRMQETITMREREFRSLADNLPDNIARWDTRGRYLYINPMHERLLGISALEIVGREIPDSHERVKAGIAQVVKTGQALLVERQTIEVDGEVLIHDVSLAPEFDDAGNLVSVLGIGRDMTVIYRMQETIAIREQEFRSLAESSPDFIARYDLEGRLHYLNTALLKRLKLHSCEQVKGARPSEIWQDGRFDSLEQANIRVVASGQAETIELCMPTENGDGLEYHHVLVVPERDARGEFFGTIIFGRNVTAIRENELRLRHFIDSLPGMAYTFQRMPDGQARFPYASSAIEDFFGLKPEDVTNDFMSLHLLSHPDDQPKIEAAMAVSAQTMSPFHIESRVCRPGLPERWLDVRAVPRQEADGSVVWYGLMLDITERKRVELDLAVSRAQLRGLIVQRESAREEERKHIAREIHDDLGQILTGMKMSISVIAQDVAEYPAVRQHVADTLALTETAIGTVRNISSAIRPVELDRGIVAALKWQASRFSTFAGIPCSVCIEDEEIQMGEAASVAVFRIVQEALTNVAKHAQANKVNILLARDGNDYVLEIADDGCGFDAGRKKSHSFGLVGMQERVHMLQGALTINAQTGNGTVIAVRFPAEIETEAGAES